MTESLEKALRQYREFRDASSPPSLNLFQSTSEALLRLGAPLAAYDCISEGLEPFADDARLRQLKALALLRSGAVDAAVELLQQLINDGFDDEETLGMLARAQKDRAEHYPGADSTSQWQAAFQAYDHAYQITDGYWTGINAATIAKILHHEEDAVRLANRVEGQCRALLHQPETDEGELYWLKATLAEALLVRGEMDRAIDWYRKASAPRSHHFGDLASTLRNSRLLIKAMDLPQHVREQIKQAIKVPNVTIFHCSESPFPGKENDPLAQSLELSLQASLVDLFQSHQVKEAYAAVNGPWDIIFLETALQNHGHARVVLSTSVSELKDRLASESFDEHWLQRLDKLLEQAVEVFPASGLLTDPASAVAYAHKLGLGLAMKKAEELGTDIIGISLTGSTGSQDSDASSTQPQLWQDRRIKTETVQLDLDTVNTSEDETSPGRARSDGPVPASQGIGPTSEKGFLFADAVGFSKLEDQQIPVFMEKYLTTVAELLETSGIKTLAKETWGDGLYLVFSNTADAGHIALTISRALSTDTFAQMGLPETLCLRISLHAGPAFYYHNPVTGQAGYTGSHVSRAARIEPITPPGMVYASQAFAAIAAAEGATGFTCDYVGQTPLAKKYGTFPTFALRGTYNPAGPAI